ncbi:hypothetical protein D3C87_1542310 [compost metagenome]
MPSAMPRSLTIRSRPKPELNWRDSTNCLNFFCVELFMPVDALSTSTITFGSRPNCWPISIASTPIRKPPADTRLFNAFMACALPTPPTAVIAEPMADSAGRTRSSVAAGPPNMMDRSPVRARGTPPDTGASTISPPAAATACASRWVCAGTPELMSTTTLPGRSAASTPCSPLSTCSTMALVGSIVKMRSAWAASSAQVAAA